MSRKVATPSKSLDYDTLKVMGSCYAEWVFRNDRDDVVECLVQCEDMKKIDYDTALNAVNSKEYSWKNSLMMKFAYDITKEKKGDITIADLLKFQRNEALSLMEDVNETIEKRQSE